MSHQIKKPEATALFQRAEHPSPFVKGQPHRPAVIYMDPAEYPEAVFAPRGNPKGGKKAPPKPLEEMTKTELIEYAKGGP